VRAGWLAAELVLERAGRGCRLALHVEKTRGILALTTWGRAAKAKRRARGGVPMA